MVIASPDQTSASLAIEMIERLTESPEIGKNYTGEVRRVEGYGAFVEILPGRDGLLHISEMAVMPAPGTASPPCRWTSRSPA